MNQLTPQAIRDRAYAARVSIITLFGKAGVSNSTLWRWEQDPAVAPHPVTLGKIEDALGHFEAAHQAGEAA